VDPPPGNRILKWGCDGLESRGGCHRLQSESVACTLGGGWGAIRCNHRRWRDRLGGGHHRFESDAGDTTSTRSGWRRCGIGNRSGGKARWNLTHDGIDAGWNQGCDILAQGFHMIYRILIPSRYTFFSESPTTKKFGVKCAWLKAILEWVTNQEVFPVAQK
jgi:hypothetical protein